MQNVPSDIRKVLGAATNSEGWAHYCEQMVIDEGFHADDPRYRLAQLQDALLRDARFIQDFHDAFIKLGPPPLPLVRKAMLSETGRLF